MNWHQLIEIDWADLIDRLADDVHHAPERAATDRDRNWPAQIDGLHAANHAIGCGHCDATRSSFAEVLLHFENDIDGHRHLKAVTDYTKGLVNRWHRRLVKLHVYCGTGNLDDTSDIFWHKTSETVISNSAQAPALLRAEC